MNQAKQAARMAQIPLFSVLSQVELEHLAATLRPCEFAPGSLLMREGERDEHFYLLLEGEVEVIKALGTPDERLLAVSTGSALFGEMSLFNPQGCHTASVRARTAARTLEMTRLDFDQLLHRRPTLAYELVRRMSRRLEESENATIQDLREKNRQLTRAYQELQAAQARLVEQEKLERELAIARQIQESILPERLPQLDGFEIAALSRPARAVGGDYYDFIALDGGRIGVVVADACDKGIPAALFINLTNSLVHIEAPRSPSPESALRLVNRHLLEMNRSGMFVTLLYGVLDPEGRFSYCRAGHPRPLVLDVDLHPVETGSSTGSPLGILEDVQLDARTVVIPAGGLLLLFSDGLSEALDAAGDLLGVQRLTAALTGLGRLPAGQVCARLWELVQDFSSGQPQSDDFTAVVIKRVSG